MEILRIENLSFSYPGAETPALHGVNLSVEQGEFILLCGETGCGKTSLLRLIKKELAPAGEQSGEIFFENKPIAALTPENSARNIGFVFQNPENSIVTDKVWHELAFGLENLGIGTQAMRRAVAETACYFGIADWFDSKTDELSGGQKQILNLAAVMTMRPRLLLLDEPTSQLDPISASRFFQTLKRLNTELGVSIIMAEHRLEEAFSLADRVVVLENGGVLCNEKPENVAAAFKNAPGKHGIFPALPTAVRLYSMLGGNAASPVSVRDMRAYLTENYKNDIKEPPSAPPAPFSENALECSGLYFRYEKKSPDILKGVDMSVPSGCVYSLLGANGGGKTTLLCSLAGLIKPYRGSIKILGKALRSYQGNSLYRGVLSLLPQDVQTLFIKDTLREDYDMLLSSLSCTKEQREQKIEETARRFGLEALLGSHPYDLSGGEQQKAALAKCLLSNPRILLADEPSKGLDGEAKKRLGALFKELAAEGRTVVLVTHDLEFAAEYSDICALFFSGELFSAAAPREFFSGNNFYTTAANRIARDMFSGVVSAAELYELCRLNGRKND